MAGGGGWGWLVRAAFYAPIFRELGVRARIYASPFKRTLQSAWPLASTLGPSDAPVTVHP